VQSVDVTRPLVAVLTPVYNGEAYLAQCVESVLAQTYPAWEHILVDNASTDGTGDILRAYAARDPRIRVHTNRRLVPVIANYNVAIRQIRPETRWCKFLSADDVLVPRCLERMTELAEAHPSVGLISAYQRRDQTIVPATPPPRSRVTDGWAIARASLFGQLSAFGGSSAHMIRADLIRRDPFYDESNLHADTAACYEVLRSSDFGFVHEVLTCARAHPGSITHSISRRLNTYLLGHLKILTVHGPVYLTPDEYRQVLEQRLETYYRFLARAVLASGGREIWRFHRDGLRSLGFPVSRRRLVATLLRQMHEVIQSPLTGLPKVRDLVRGRRGDDANWRQWWAPTGFESVKPPSDVDQAGAARRKGSPAEVHTADARPHRNSSREG
jgi:glycosyltransferase involved in cell wall biosynthesis